jgi:hypothetical protein
VITYTAPDKHEFIKLKLGSKYRTKELNICKIILENKNMKYVEPLKISSLNGDNYVLFIKHL